MGSPFVCKKHGKVFGVATSPMLARAIADGSELSDELEIVTLEVTTQDDVSKTTSNLLDAEFASEFELIPVGGLIKLRDRSKREKILNDRLVLNQIFARTVMVCPLCLEELVARYRERPDQSSRV